MSRSIALFSSTMCVFFLATSVLAQSAPIIAPMPPANPATTRPSEAEPDELTSQLHPEDVSNEDRPFQLELPSADLFNDWYTFRSDLEHFGITPTMDLEVDTAANPSGGKREGITEASNLGLDMLADLNKIAVRAVGRQSFQAVHRQRL
jgi:hypothetical protein